MRRAHLSRSCVHPMEMAKASGASRAWIDTTACPGAGREGAKHGETRSKGGSEARGDKGSGRERGKGRQGVREGARHGETRNQRYAME